MAATLVADHAVLSHRSAAALWGIRPYGGRIEVIAAHAHRRGRLERAATEAEIRRLMSPTSLDALVARYPSRPGTAAIRALLATNRIGQAITRDELELRFLTFLDDHNLPRPSINATIELRDKPRTVDCLWPHRNLIAELDGFATHGTRSAFEEDRARDRALNAAGYRTIRITWRHLADDPKTLAAEIEALLTTK
jgi:hypothetical protein